LSGFIDLSAVRDWAPRDRRCAIITRWHPDKVHSAVLQTARQ